MAFPTIKANKGNLCIIYTTKAGGNYPIHGAYLIKNGDENVWVPTFWGIDGKHSHKTGSGLDITNELHKIKIHDAQKQISEGSEVDFQSEEKPL